MGRCGRLPYRSLQAALAARLDRVALGKDVAVLGAAIGRDFTHELIAAVSTFDSTDLDAGRLTDAGLISRRGAPPDSIYSFKHALVQDAAYATLLKSRRQQVHARRLAESARDTRACDLSAPRQRTHPLAALRDSLLRVGDGGARRGGRRPEPGQGR
jgi:hypothetical protein